jgi:hypothetical protein
MEHMQLQEDKCRPGRMQLKLKHHLVLGGSLAILHPLSNREPGASITDLWNQ